MDPVELLKKSSISDTVNSSTSNEALESRINILRKEIFNEKERNASLRDVNNTLKNEYKTLAKKYKDLKSAYSSLKTEHEALVKTYSDLLDKYVAVVTEFANADDEEVKEFVSAKELYSERKEYQMYQQSDFTPSKSSQSSMSENHDSHSKAAGSNCFETPIKLNTDKFSFNEVNEQDSNNATAKPGGILFSKDSCEESIERRRATYSNDQFNLVKDLGDRILALRYKPLVSPPESKDQKTRPGRSNSVFEFVPKTVPKRKGTSTNEFEADFSIIPEEQIPQKGEKISPKESELENNLLKKDPKAVQKIGSKIFEEFFVVGPRKQELLKYESDNPSSQSGSLTPEYIYSYPKDQNLLNTPRRNILHAFTFPFGVPIRKLKNQGSFSKVNDKDINEKTFVVVLKSEESSFNGKVHENSFLEKTNPDHILYCICLFVADYIETTPSSHEYVKKYRRNRKFWKTHNVFCFLTYYPVIKLFTDTLWELQNSIKLGRIAKFTSQKAEESSILGEIDGSNFLKDEQIEAFLDKFIQIDIPDFAVTISIPGLLSSKISLEIPDIKNLEQLEVKWGVSLCFSSFPYEHFMFIIFALLLEKNVVLLSKNVAQLTSAMMTFLNMIRPFKWPHPHVFSLPEYLLPFLDSPVPFFYGINQSKEFLLREKYNKNYPEVIFYCIDESVVLYDDKELPKLISIQPYFDNLKLKLKETYMHFNSTQTSYFSKIDAKNVVVPNPKLIYSPSKKDESKSLDLIRIFREALKVFICSHIEAYINSGTMGEDALTELKSLILEKNKNNANDQIFLKNFLETQVFAYYFACVSEF